MKRSRTRTTQFAFFNLHFSICNFYLLLLAAGALVAAPAPLRSGPQIGERPLPFTSNVVTGPHRGKQHCYVCELKDVPAVLVFARRMDEPTGRLLTEVRDAVRDNQQAKLFGWFVFLAQDDAASEATLEKQTYEFARQHGATTLPISVLGDPQGPPGYLISPDAVVTVLVFQNGKVLYNRAYRAKDWTPRAADNALKELPKLLAVKPPG